MHRKTTEVARPFTLRLKPSERALLEGQAAGMPLGEFIRLRALGTQIIRRVRGNQPVKDHQQLAQLLGQLGRMRLASNLNQLVTAANSGALPDTPETQTALLEACADIREIRDAVMRALGRRA